MAEFTKEQLIERARENVNSLKFASTQHAFEQAFPAIEIDIRLAEIALAALTAGMEQEPVYQVQYGDHWRDLDKAQYDDHVNLGAEGLRIVYAAPQLPQPVPVDEDDNFYSWFGREWHENYQHNQYTTAAKQMLGVMAESAWRAGRSAAMLQGAEPVQAESPAQHWYLVSWRTAAGNFWYGDVALDKPWSCGSARIAAGLIAEACPELKGQAVIIQSVMRIQPSECPPKQDESAQNPIICRSDERNMEMPEIAAGVIKFIGSLDNGFCHKHPDTPLLKHPCMQLAVYPPRPATYCPKCEPHVAEWEERDKQLRKGKGVKRG